MKLRWIRIENFRQVGHWEHHFADSLGRVRDLTVLVGPNASGKTSILDAVATALNTLVRLSTVRPGLELSLKRIVRHGAVFARVEMEVEFAPEELETAVTVVRNLEKQFPREEESIRASRVVRFTWTYPDPRGTLSAGRTESAHRGEWWSAFRTRSRLAQLLATGRMKDFQVLESAGAVFTFDQERALFGRTIPRAVWEILATTGSLPTTTPPPEAGLGYPTTTTTPPPDPVAEHPAADRWTTDPRLLLLALAIQDALPPRGDGARPPSDFARVKEAYARVCSPHQIRGAVRDDLERFDLEFVTATTPYRYADLSSGEQMVLLLLIRMVTERIHRSIVLIDEIELHQHPVWQRRILHQLPLMGVGNQFIVTTHSAYIRDLIPANQLVALGDLD